MRRSRLSAPVRSVSLSGVALTSFSIFLCARLTAAYLATGQHLMRYLRMQTFMLLPVGIDERLTVAKAGSSVVAICGHQRCRTAELMRGN